MSLGIRKLLVLSHTLIACAAVTILSLAFTAVLSSHTGLRAAVLTVALTALGVILASTLLAYIASKRISGPITDLQQTVRRLAASDLEARAMPSSIEELSDVADGLSRLASRLENLETVYTDFVANASHELRSPVSNIRVTSEVLGRRADKLGDDASRLFRVIIAETERLEHMIDELMELSSIESGALVLDMESVNVRALVEELVAVLQPRTEQKGLSVGVLADPDLQIPADRDRLARAVNNLLDNAVKFTPDGGQIMVSARQSKRGVTIEVSDTGGGIPSEELPRLFERFYRADKSRRREGGTGIGLPIVKSIVEAHGGEVDVQSEEGVGSRFVIRLPVHAPDARR